MRERPFTDLESAASSPIKRVRDAARIEIKYRNDNWKLTTKQKEFVTELQGAQQNVKYLRDVIIPQLGHPTMGEVMVRAGQFMAGGIGLPPIWSEYFTQIGSAYQNLWYAAKATAVGGGGGIGLIHELSPHFPRGPNKFPPDMPSEALGKLEQTLLSKEAASLVKQADLLDRQQWKYDHGEDPDAPYLTPESREIVAGLKAKYGSH